MKMYAKFLVTVCSLMAFSIIAMEKTANQKSNYRGLAISMTDEVLLSKSKSTDREFINLIQNAYPEMNYLTSPAHASPEGQASAHESSPSKLLFGKQHIEYDRTIVGILALKWVLVDDYDHFVEGQPEHIKLKRESFNELRTLTLKVIKNGMLNALVTSLVINDLGKIISFVKEVEGRTGMSEVDHDNILFTALLKYQNLFLALLI